MLVDFRKSHWTFLCEVYKLNHPMELNKGDLFMIKFTSEMSELLGIMFGDGCLSHAKNKNVVYISGHKIDDFEYHNQITRKLFLNIFDKKIKIKYRKKENTLFIRFSDKKIFTCLKKSGMVVGLKNNKLNVPKRIVQDSKHMYPFLRGIVDTDGCIVFSKQHRKRPYYPRIEITNKSKRFLNQLFCFLVNKEFYGSISNKGRGYRLEIPGFRNLKKWIDFIGFSNPKHIKKIEAHFGPLHAPSQTRTGDLYRFNLKS